MSVEVTTNSDGLVEIVDLNPGPIEYVELQQGPPGHASDNIDGGEADEIYDEEYTIDGGEV